MINGTMWVHLTVQAAYQILILFLIIYGAPNAIDRYRLPSPCNTYSNIDGAVSFLYFDPTERPILFVLWHCLHAFQKLHILARNSIFVCLLSLN